LRIDVFDLFLHHECGSYVSFMLLWEYIDILFWMFGKCIMGYEYFIYSMDMCLELSI
jgi:hypothetical protein